MILRYIKTVKVYSSVYGTEEDVEEWSYEVTGRELSDAITDIVIENDFSFMYKSKQWKKFYKAMKDMYSDFGESYIEELAEVYYDELKEYFEEEARYNRD